MTRTNSGADQPGEQQQRRLRQLVSTLRAHGGIATVSARCHHDVPDVDGVVLTVFADHAGRIIISDSGSRGDQLEDLHLTLGEGPSIDAATTRKPVTVADLNQPRPQASWPRFAAQALNSGLRAVFAYPLLLHTQPIGVLSLYRASPGPLSVADHEQIDRYTRAVTVLLLNDPHLNAAGRLNMVLPRQAVEVQQAVGIVMEYAGVDAATALHRLRSYAHQSTRPMREVVAEVRTCRLPFDPTTPT